MDAGIANKSQKKVTKRGRASQNFRKKKALKNASAARSATLNMKIDKTGFFSKKDLPYFITTFFPEAHPLPYSRLRPLPKLLVCQYVLHSQLENNLQSIPFVFRLSPELSQLEDSYLKKKIQRKLKTALQRAPLYWLTTEYDTMTETRGKHLNGEICLYPGEIEKCEQAFRELFGLHRINPDTNQLIRKADGSIRQKKGLRFAINFPIASRNKEAKNKGEFYAVYNWPSYAMKQVTFRNHERKAGRSNKKKELFHYVSDELNKMASSLYSECIYNK